MLFTVVWEREGKMKGTAKEEIKRIADQFAFTGELVSCGPCGSGHINETYMLRYRIGDMGSIKVILQKINREIFQKPEELMENIAGVTGHLKKKVLHFASVHKEKLENIDKQIKIIQNMPNADNLIMKSKNESIPTMQNPF